MVSARGVPTSRPCGAAYASPSPQGRLYAVPSPSFHRSTSVQRKTQFPVKQSAPEQESRPPPSGRPRIPNSKRLARHSPTTVAFGCAQSAVAGTYSASGLERMPPGRAATGTRPCRSRPTVLTNWAAALASGRRRDHRLLKRKYGMRRTRLRWHPASALFCAVALSTNYPRQAALGP